MNPHSPFTALWHACEAGKEHARRGAASMHTRLTGALREAYLSGYESVSAAEQSFAIVDYEIKTTTLAP